MGQAGKSALESLAFPGTWRGYQRLALDAFEADRARGERRTHIVAPPGSGKTLLGMEIIRRIGERALVLVPNTAVQTQWLQTAGTFGAASGVAAADPTAAVACLTYQALCQLDDPAAAIRQEAEHRWAAARARSSGDSPAESHRSSAAWTGAAAERRNREIARICASIKREIARGSGSRISLDDLLGAGARSRLAALRLGGVATVVLDECHHLASMWGYVVRAALADLPGVHVIGLTATPPDALTDEEDELYAGLLGPVDFTVPTPALVRDRALAPYQELAWLTRPLESETAWLAEHDLRFQELITALHADTTGVTSLPEWVLTRLRDRGRGRQESAMVPWTTFQRARPALARAGARFLASAGLELPAGVPRGEGYREQPDLDDWLVLLDDYALRCLAPDPRPHAAAQYESISGALRALGFSLTRQGIRRGASDVDRLLANSAAKAMAIADVVAAEFGCRGQRLRALVLADTEMAAAPGRGLADVLPADAGSAPAALRAIAADPRTSALRPLLVTGRGLRCSPDDADALLAALRDAAGGARHVWKAEPGDAGLLRLSAATADWQPRRWVELATRIFAAGSTRVLVGTRAMLGEGWDAPCVNCLVDLSSATTAVSVQQSRGRALRLDPADPDKIASNWDIICVAPELTRGTSDYQRFVRKHLHLLAPTEDGAIEAGPSHVHPAFGPFAPPAAGAFAEINESMLERAASSDLARERWRVGEPYKAELLHTLVILPRHGGRARDRSHVQPPAYPVGQRRAALLAGAGAIVCAVGATGGSAAAAIAGAAAVPCAGAWAAVRTALALRTVADVLPLDLVARAICECYASLGELSAAAAGSLTIEPRASGYLRCYLQGATAAENGLFSTALDDVLCPAQFPRYLVSRLAPAQAGAARSLARALTFKSPFDRRWVAVPADLGRTKQRAEQYCAAWSRWLGPAELQFTQRSEAGRQAAAQACAEQADYVTSERLVWV